MSKKKLTILTYILAGLAGFLLAKIVGNIKAFSLDDKIDPVALFSLLLTALISVFFFRKFERQKYSDQLRKDALLRRLHFLFDRLVSLEELCEQKSIKYTDVVSSLKKCRREFAGYVRFAEAVSSPIIEKEKKNYYAICHTLLTLLTDTPKDDNTDKPLKIVDGLLAISGDRMVEVEQKIAEAKRVLFSAEKAVILDV